MVDEQETVHVHTDNTNASNLFTSDVFKDEIQKIPKTPVGHSQTPQQDELRKKSSDDLMGHTDER